MHRSKFALASLAIAALAAFAGQSEAQTLDTLTSFAPPGGIFPANSLTLSGSTLYGTTINGGPDGVGTVFSLPVTGGTATTLGTFSGARRLDSLQQFGFDALGIDPVRNDLHRRSQ